MINRVLLIHTIPELHKDIKRMKRFAKKKYRVKDSSISTLDLTSCTDQRCTFVGNEIKKYVIQCHNCGTCIVVFFSSSFHLISLECEFW